MEAESPTPTCVICLGELESECAPLEPCGHGQFHADCLVRAMRTNPACPICRDPGAAGVAAAAAPPLEAPPRASDSESMVVGLEFTDVPFSYRENLERMLENIVSNVAEEIDHELSASTARRERRRHNQRARADPAVREERDRYWEARRARQTAERALRTACRPLDREMGALVAKHRAQTQRMRDQLTEALQREGEAEARFRAAAE